MRGLFAHGQKVINPFPGHDAAHLPVQGRAILSQLQHVAQNGDSFALLFEVYQCFQSGGHGTGIGIVTVIYYVDVAGKS